MYRFDQLDLSLISPNQRSKVQYYEGETIGVTLPPDRKLNYMVMGYSACITDTFADELQLS